jgi:hyperosmotically inducible periplasmic protein
MKNSIACTLIALSCTCVSFYAGAQAPATATTVAADNAKSNKVDPSNSTATSDAQTNKASDIDVTRRIRQSVMADKSLSMYAHNVKIVTVNGSVTLNGVVRSADEKNAVETKAAAIAGKDNVTDSLKVSPSN